MKILKSKQFQQSLRSIVLFIAKDSKNRAMNFKNTLHTYLEDLNNMPYKYRKSLYHDSENIRDLIFKGYTIPYIINEEKDVILILDIFKWIDKEQR